MNAIIGFFKELFEKRYVISQLVQRDVKEKYLGSLLGILWPFLQQLATVLIMSFVLEMGLKAGGVGGVSFFLFLVVGQALWGFFSEAVSSSTNVFMQYTYLVKKINFRLAILPLVKVISSFVNHFLFLLVVVLMLAVSGIYPNWYWLQLPYYIIATFALLLGLGWLFSALAVFLRDVSQVIQVVLTFLFWMTPVFWNMEQAGTLLKTIGWFNPIAYLVEGYRSCFLFQRPLWVDPLWTLYYWSVVALFLLLGVIVFRRLKPHFADVL